MIRVNESAPLGAAKATPYVRHLRQSVGRYVGRYVGRPFRGAKYVGRPGAKLAAIVAAKATPYVLLAIGAAEATPYVQQPRPASSVLVFAAASLQTSLDQLIAPIQRATGVTVRVSYAGSSALARQIESGAPADLFICADLDWMDYLAGKQLIRTDSRVNLLGNRLVLIAPAAQSITLKIEPGFALAAALGRDRLALADPAAVPAGKYARAALTSLGVWNAVASKIAAAENVRAALRLVSRREAPLGIVYYTDAIADPNVRIVDTFPASTHPAIVYPAALTSVASPAAAKVLDYLKSNAAQNVFVAQGFSRN